VVSEGVLRIEADTLTNIPSDEELRLLQARASSAGEVASVRLREGEVVYSDGANRVQSGIRLAPGRWYRSALTLDLSAQTYAVELRDATSGAIILQDEDLGWRSTDAQSVNRVCAQLPPQPGLDLYLDDVRVMAIAGGSD
jgi:hypothetical protein